MCVIHNSKAVEGSARQRESTCGPVTPLEARAAPFAGRPSRRARAEAFAPEPTRTSVLSQRPRLAFSAQQHISGAVSPGRRRAALLPAPLGPLVFDAGTGPPGGSPAKDGAFVAPGHLLVSVTLLSTRRLRPWPGCEGAAPAGVGSGEPPQRGAPSEGRRTCPGGVWGDEGLRLQPRPSPFPLQPQFASSSASAPDA